MRLYRLIAASLLICVLLLLRINDTNSVCKTAQNNHYYLLIIFSHAELKILLLWEWQCSGSALKGEHTLSWLKS